MKIWENKMSRGVFKIAGYLLLLMLSASIVLNAAPGDITEVQTFTFDDISERRMEFEFPGDDRTWSKILTTQSFLLTKKGSLPT